MTMNFLYMMILVFNRLNVSNFWVHLNFSEHIDEVVSKCDKRIFLLRQLKILGMNATGLKTFYCSNIRSVLSYAAPEFYTMLSDHD